MSTAGYTTNPVPCAGCGNPTPYGVGEVPSPDTSYGEHLMTRLGRGFFRTHWDRECVRRSREAVDGKPVIVKEAEV